MTIGCETTPETNSVERKWQTYAGTDVTIHVSQESSLVEHAPEELHRAEQVVEALRKLLMPPEEGASGPIDIYLLDSTDVRSEEGFPSASQANESDPPEERPRGEAIFCTFDPEIVGKPLIKPLTRHVIARWFG